MSMYCTGKHQFKTISEPGATPYLLCHCGKAELIPGATRIQPQSEIPANDTVWWTLAVLGMVALFLFLSY